MLGPQERVDAGTALRAVTVNAARQYGEADKGSIRPGMRADFAVLSDNPLTVPPSRLRSLRVEETLCAGESLWRREDGFGPAGR